LPTVQLRRLVIPALITLGAALLYLPDLGDAPAYLNRDEMFFGLTAHSLASTGHDTTGRFLPLYFQTQMRYGSEMWFQPMLMYSATATVKLFGLSEAAIRLPMALAGVIDVVLVYFIARVLVERELPAIVAAALLALSPAHFINSRVAMDFQAPLPFLLGWLLCVCLYFRREQVWLLFAGGLFLGIGLYTYIAAYMLMPIYALLTCAALWHRREPATRYWALAAGFLAPALCAVPFLVWHPTVLHDVFWHYQREQPQDAGTYGLFLDFFAWDRFSKAASVYLGFWSPRFLFVDGPQSMWIAGAFTLSVSGSLIVGVISAQPRRTVYRILLIGGLLTAAIPASLVGDPEAIHRAAEVLPFGALIAMLGLNAVSTTGTSRARHLAFAAPWVILIMLAAAYHDQLPLAQGFIRASTVPLAVAGLAVLLRQATVDPFRDWQLAVAACATLASMQVAYFLVGYATAAWASAAVLAVAAVAMRRDMADQRRPWAFFITAALAVAASDFMSAHVNYSGIHRMQLVPASAILMMLRFAAAGCAMAAALGFALQMRRVSGPLSVARFAVLIAATVVAIQLAYFYVDRVTDYRLQLIGATVIFITAITAAVLLARGGMTVSRASLPPIAAAALLGVTALQFGPFYRDYFTRYRAHSGNFEPEGNGRVAWETLIDRARNRSVPAIYVGNAGPYGFNDLYWTFYAIKHHRDDLLARTVSTVEFEPDRVRDLPHGSLVVTSPSPQSDAVIDVLLASGALRDKVLVTAPDERSMFWILETGPPRHAGTSVLSR
jgi:4-amino-4-deoxy-L-arabinose transferase-like glycosyltransferase